VNRPTGCEQSCLSLEVNSTPDSKELTIARNKNQNTFAKRQREQDKKRRADDKLKRRGQRAHQPDLPPASQTVNQGDVRPGEEPVV